MLGLTCERHEGYSTSVLRTGQEGCGVNEGLTGIIEGEGGGYAHPLQSVRGGLKLPVRGLVGVIPPGSTSKPT